MNELSNNPDLKEINAFKKKLTWGEVPTIYQMAQSSVGELAGTLTHGFDNSFKNLLNKNLWNLKLLGGYQDKQGDIQVKSKPQISLKHVYDEDHYELHCYPIVEGELLYSSLLKHPLCPFENWMPESMRILLRVNSLVSFILYAFRTGDKADMALIKHAHIQLMNLIDVLHQSFDVVNIVGYNIADFCNEINQRKNSTDISDMFNSSE